MNEIFKKLEAPFPEDWILWRISRTGIHKDKIWATALAYLDARAVMDRFDNVLGPENWQDSYRKEGDAYIGKISIKFYDKWISKEDAADSTDIEAVKGGVSGAFKRAAVKWKIGRYLYGLSEEYVTIVEKGTPGARYGTTSKEQGKKPFFWLPPKLPEWALPPKVVMVTKMQLKNMFQIASRNGYTENDLKLMIGDRPSTELTFEEYQEIIKKVQNVQAGG